MEVGNDEEGELGAGRDEEVTKSGVVLARGAADTSGIWEIGKETEGGSEVGREGKKEEVNGKRCSLNRTSLETKIRPSEARHL